MRIFKQWVVAIALYVAMILDGCLAAVLHQTMSYGNSRASLLLLPIAVMVVAFEDDRNAKEVWLWRPGSLPTFTFTASLASTR